MAAGVESKGVKGVKGVKGDKGVNSVEGVEDVRIVTEFASTIESVQIKAG